MQAETTIYFVVWWVLLEYSSFDHFPFMDYLPEAVRVLVGLGVRL